MSIFRDTFQANIKKSLEVRQNAMTNYTPQNIQYLNTRNAWIRLSSAVNVNGSSNLAKSYILCGGTLNSDGTFKSGIGTDKEAYSTKTPGGTPHRLGIRPMPGIISLNVKSKSNYGSLKEATVNFQCWDVAQLEELEQLYMRSGYTALVEWGWVPYIDHNGKYHSTYSDFYSDTFLNPKKSEDFDRDSILDTLYKKCINSGGNYDALYGYIKNYQWSAREDGGYDCQVNIISTGEVIESIKVNYVRADLAEYKMYNSSSVLGDGFLNELFTKQGNNPSTKFADYYQKNTLAGVWAELALKIKDPNAKTLTTKGANYLSKKNVVPTLDGLTNYGDFNQFIEPGSGIKVYITLEAAFDIMNEYIIARSGTDKKPLVKLSTKTPTYSGKAESNLLCVAHPLQVSVDPTVCLIKSPLWYEKVLPLIKESTAATATTANTVADNIVKDLKNASEGNGVRATAFIAAIQKITDPTTFSVVNSTFTGNDPDNWKYSDGLVGLIKEQFEQANTPSTLYNVYLIQQALKASNTTLEINLTPKATSQSATTLTAVLNNRVPTANFENIAELLNPSKELLYTTGNITIATTAAAATTATFVLSTSDALAALDILKTLDQPYFYEEKPDKELGIIGNIYVSLDFLYRQSLNQSLESSDSKEKNEINLYNYIKTVMSGIQTALGNLNNFEIHVDPVDNVARVIDINYTAPNKPSNLFELQVQNNNSIVHSYSLKSQTFPAQSAIVSIGAQSGKGGQMGMQTNTMIDFNKSVTDRIIKKKGDPIRNSLDTNNEQNPSLAASLAGIVILFGLLGKKPTEGTANTINIGESVSKAKNSLRDLIIYFQNLVASPGRNRNILPFKFSFKMDGIGGLVVGSLFKINKDALPRGYKGEKGIGTEIAQTITSINHTISNNSWTTDIGALNVVLDRPELGGFSKLSIASIIRKATDLIISAGVGTPPYPAAYTTVPPTSFSPAANVGIPGSNNLTGGVISGNNKPLNTLSAPTQAAINAGGKLVLVREASNNKRTIGTMWYKGQVLGFTVEDTIRTTKVTSQTAIPPGEYNMTLDTTGNASLIRCYVTFPNDPRPKFRSPGVFARVGTSKSAVSLKGSGIYSSLSFEGIRIHDGSTEGYSAGCIIYSSKRNADGTVVKDTEHNKQLTRLIYQDNIAKILVIHEF